MRRSLWRLRPVLSLVTIVVAVVALVLVWTGRAAPIGPLLATLVALLVVGEVIGRTCRPATAPPELGAIERVELRDERERAGEVAAVRRLRRAHPGLGLADAVALVRGLD